MAKGYWIPHLDVSNPQGFQAYRDTADAWHKTNGSRLLARGGRSEVMEGKMRSRNVIREYDSFDVAVNAYHSPEYSRAHPLREPHSQCDFPIVEGYDGPQPAPVGRRPPPGPVRVTGSPTSISPTPRATRLIRPPTPNRSACSALRFLVRGGRQEVMEGKVRSRCVIMEFPSYEAALACYRSPEYQAAKALRQGKGEIDLIVNDGYSGD